MIDISEERFSPNLPGPERFHMFLHHMENSRGGMHIAQLRGTTKGVSRFNPFFLFLYARSFAVLSKV